MKSILEKLWIFTVLLIIISSSLNFKKTYASEEEFSDVGAGNTNYVAINYLKSLGLVEGYEDNTFKPKAKINRAEAMKMITLACGLKTEDVDLSGAEAPFSDTPVDAWFTKYLIAAKENEIINGYPDGSFKPEQEINLVETLKIYLECLEEVTYPEGEEYLYADTPADAWFAKYTNYASSKNLLPVNLDNNINPDQKMTRGYLAEIIYRNTVANDGYNFGKATFYGAAVHGNGTASGEIFDMNGFTAAHRTLPFGSLAEVTNLANGKFVNVKITDRGPYGAGRVLDLSSAAFEQLASLSTGVINVRYRVVENQ